MASPEPVGNYEYDLFISYTRDPDAELALEIERFLEAFHLTPPPSENDTQLPAPQSMPAGIVLSWGTYVVVCASRNRVVSR